MVKMLTTVKKATFSQLKPEFLPNVIFLKQIDEIDSDGDVNSLGFAY